MPTGWGHQKKGVNPWLNPHGEPEKKKNSIRHYLQYSL